LQRKGSLAGWYAPCLRARQPALRLEARMLPLVLMLLAVVVFVFIVLRLAGIV
jgi:hypothetical protein